MKTAQERVAALHARAAQLRRRREDAALGRLGAVCGMLAVCLTGMTFSMSRAHAGILPGQYMGATMLFESAGGYVLVAVIAFAVGVGIAAALIYRRKKENADKTAKKGGND